MQELIATPGNPLPGGVVIYTDAARRTTLRSEMRGGEFRIRLDELDSCRPE
ncbi:MAG: hypothetical protein OXN89_03485 [Bryobacterales bacterium]|nr:hypothetical protein [Bryobacterales bacterium]